MKYSLWLCIGSSVPSVNLLASLGDAGRYLPACHHHPTCKFPCTMRFGSTAKVVVMCMLNCYRTSECLESVPKRCCCCHAWQSQALPVPFGDAGRGCRGFAGQNRAGCSSGRRCVFSTQQQQSYEAIWQPEPAGERTEPRGVPGSPIRD